MFRKGFARFSVGLLAVMVFALPVLLVGAQNDSAPVSIEFIGVIEAMNATTITVNGQVIDISGAELDTALTVGASVKVEGTLGAGGAVTAREIESADDVLQPGEIEFEGAVESFDGTTLVIGGMRLVVSTDADVDDSVQVGDFVEIKLVNAANGELVVVEIDVDQDDDRDDLDDGNDDNDDDDANDDNDDLGNDDDANDDNDDDANDDNDDDGNDDNDDFGNDDDGNDDDDEDVRLTGTLEAIGDGFIVVGGQQIDTTTAEIDDNLVLGGLVDVELFIVNGQLVATEVDYADTDDDDGNQGGINIGGSTGCPVPAGWTTYTIGAGDSLSDVGARSGSSAGELAQANCMGLSDIIHPGDVIAVPRTPDPRPVFSRDNDDDDDDDDDFGNDDDGNDDDDFGNDDDGNDDDNDGNDDDGNDDNGGDNDDDDDDDNGGDNDDDDDDDDNSGRGGGDDDDDDDDD